MKLNWQLHLYEPRHDKTDKMSVRPAKTQISLGIFAVRMKKVWVISHPLCTRLLCWFCHVAAHIPASKLKRIALFLSHQRFRISFTDEPLQDEPRHDKTNKVSMRPAKTQISRGISPV